MSFTFVVGTVETQCTHQPGYGWERSGCQLQGLGKQWMQGFNSIGIHKDTWLVCSHFQCFQLFSAHRPYLLFWHYASTMVISAKLPDPLCCQDLKAVMEQQGGACPTREGKPAVEGQCRAVTSLLRVQSHSTWRIGVGLMAVTSFTQQLCDHWTSPCRWGMSMSHKEVKSSRQRQNQTGTGLNSCKAD